MNTDNLLFETIKTLEKRNKFINDVEYVLFYKKWCKWIEFENIAKNINYDKGFGSQEISPYLTIVGKDWWLERHEYDGSEWWEFKTLPSKFNLPHCVPTIEDFTRY